MTEPSNEKYKQQKKKALEDILAQINEAIKSKDPFAIFIIRPTNQFIGAYNPQPNKPFPDLTDEALEAGIDLLLHYVKPRNLRGYMNSLVDNYMILNYNRFLDDLQQKRIEEGSESGYLDDKI